MSRTRKDFGVFPVSARNPSRVDQMEKPPGDPVSSSLASVVKAFTIPAGQAPAHVPAVECPPVQVLAPDGGLPHQGLAPGDPGEPPGPAPPGRRRPRSSVTPRRNMEQLVQSSRLGMKQVAENDIKRASRTVTRRVVSFLPTCYINTLHNSLS